MRVTRAIALVLAVGLPGCALRAPRPVVPPGTTARALLDDLAARRTALQSLRGRLQIRSGLARVWAREAVLVQRPRGIRVDVLSPFGLALALGTDGSTLWVYPPQEGLRYEGPATPENLARFLGAPVRLEDLVDVLLGLPPERSAAGRPWLEQRDGMARVIVPTDRGLQRLDFGGEPFAVRRVEEERDGRLVLQLGFDDYRDGFPYEIDVRGPEAEDAARLRYVSLERNVPIDDAAFAGPQAVRRAPLDAIAVRR